LYALFGIHGHSPWCGAACLQPLQGQRAGSAVYSLAPKKR